MSLHMIRFVTDFASAFFPCLGTIIILGENLRKLWFKALVFGVIYGSIVFFTDGIQPIIISILITAFTPYPLFKYIFGLKNWFTTKSFVIFTLLTFSTALTCAFVIKYGLNLQAYQVNLPKSVWLKVLLPMQLVNLPLAFIIRGAKNKILYFFAKIKENQSLSVFRSLWQLILIQTLLLMIIIATVINDVQIKTNILNSAILALTVFLSIFLYVLILNKSISISAARTLEATQDSISDNVMSLINSVRSQRHDFINHIQVISSLLQLENLKGMHSYLSELMDDVSVINDIIKANNPIIAGLLNAKMIAAERKKINFKVDVKADISHLATRSIDLTRILGNLIDNALDAVEHLEPSQKQVSVTITEKGSNLMFSVANPGPPPVESQLKLFEPGFTTKDDSHSGLGLYICKQLAQKLHGSINHSYDPLLGNNFSLEIPKS